MGHHVTDIGIVGYGRFGRALGELARGRGLRVVACDAVDPVPEPLCVSSMQAMAQRASAIILAVPVAAVSQALAGIAPFLTPSHLVLDVCSVKLAPIAAMRALLGDRVPWLGAHPLFGPTSVALGERPLVTVLCPTPEHPSALPIARQLFNRLGSDVVEQDPEAHDRAMAETHALAFFIAKGLLDARAGEEAPYTPPSFQAMARTIESVRGDAGHLFLSIERENPFAAGARHRLLEALHAIDTQLSRAPDPHDQPLAIPGLGKSAPDLMETRDLIDGVDRELFDLLRRRAELALRAHRAKTLAGRGVLDPERERRLLEERAIWAEQAGLPKEALKDVYEAILRFSRTIQSTASDGP